MHICTNKLKKRLLLSKIGLTFLSLSTLTSAILCTGISYAKESSAEGSNDSSPGSKESSSGSKESSIGSVKSSTKTAKEGSTEHPVTAIDILLKPDATMCKHAREANTELLNNYPKGFVLDGTHNPHITLLQRYIKTADLDKVYSAASEVLAKEKPTTWKLEAFKYYYGKGGSTGLAGIVVRPTEDLSRLQQELIDAVAPYALKTGTADAFVTTPEEPDIDRFTLDFVGSYVEVASGKKFNPHVTTGIGTVEYLDKLLTEPFQPFTFSPVGVSVFQLGDYGTARKELKAF